MEKKYRIFSLLLLLYYFSFSQSVELLVPSDNEELTDIAVSFKAKALGDGPYVLQVSKDATFTTGVKTQTKPKENKLVSRDFVYFYSRYGVFNASNRFMLDPGTWYWRISDDNGATFSETRTLIVNDNKPQTPVERIISPEKPFFHFRIFSKKIIEAEDPEVILKQMVPDNLKEFVVLDLGQSFDGINVKGRSLLEYSRIVNDLGYKFLLDTGRPDFEAGGRAVLSAEVEQIFKELPNCVGAATSELFYGYLYNEDVRSQFDQIMELCRKYGKVFSYGDMNWVDAKWPLFAYENYDLYTTDGYQDYLLPQNKTTDPWGAFTNVSALQGMKLSGMVKNIGIWSDAFCWEKFGQVNEFELLDFLSGSHQNTNGTKFHPFMQNIKMFIYGITYGSTVFTIEQDEHYHKFTGEVTDHYTRYLSPFMNFVIDEKLIPSEEAINENFKVIVDPEINTSNVSLAPNLTFVEGNIWGDFLRSTYGISTLSPYTEPVDTKHNFTIHQSAYLEMIPNTDRYPSGLPFLLKSSLSAPQVNGRSLDIVKISDLDTQAKADANLNIHYPQSTNEAYARIIDNSIFVFNTLENHDVKQSYTLDINHAGIESMSGDIDLMSYVIGKLKPDDGGSVLFQVNAYIPNQDVRRGGDYALPGYPTILKFKCSSRPNIKIDEVNAIVRYEWNEIANELTIEFDHTIAGAVNFALQQDSIVETMTLQSVPDLIFTSTSLDFSVAYNTNEARDFVVEILKPDGTTLETLTRTINPGVGNETFTINTTPAPASGKNYTIKAAVRPVGGNATQNLLEDSAVFELLTEATCASTGVYNECFEEGLGLWSTGALIRELQRDDVYAGNYTLKVTGRGSATALITGLSPNTNYEIKAFVKNLSSGRIGLGVKDFGGREISKGVNNGTYEEKVLNFTTGATNTSALMYYFSSADNVEAYLDNISIEDKGCATPNCDDLDQDGVLNKDDKCPNTTAGAIVDAEGCALFALAFDNFLIKTTGETCATKNNGLIEINAKETLNYTAVLSGNGISESKAFTSTGIFNNIPSGSYEVCITVEGEAAYKECYLIDIVEPEDLTVTSKIDTLGKNVSLSLQGGTNYNITLNNVTYKTSQKEVTLPLAAIENKLIIKTDKDCQGIYEENILIDSNENVALYPNPIREQQNITIEIGQQLVETLNLSVYTVTGRQLKNRNYIVNNGRVLFDLNDMPSGVYIVEIKTKTNSYIRKVIKN